MQIISRESQIDRRLRNEYSLVIVGSGLFGCTIAERTTKATEGRVLIIERRNHVGGNVYSEDFQDTGIPVHKYGPHIFHTSNQIVWDYVRQFTDFNHYRHHVWAKTDSGTLPLPISLATLSRLWGDNLTPDEARRKIEKLTAKISDPQNFEEKALSLVGEELYKLFFEGYTSKQWGLNPQQIPASVFSRLPIRFNRDTRYFSDKWEGIPSEGYSEFVNRMLANERIDVVLETSWDDIKDVTPTNIPIIFTGAIDEYFDYRFGQLGWRTVDFEFRVEETFDFQGCAQMNYPSASVPFTREVEYKHFHPEVRQFWEMERTVVSREFSRRALPGDDVYYPINSVEDRQKLGRYRDEAKKLKRVYLGGRLGSYQYLDMHMVIASALTFFNNELFPELQKNS